MSDKVFTEEELSKYDGTEDGQPVYFAYKGKVYDVTESPLFIDGMHFEHYSGTNLTEFMDESPHGDEVLEEFKVVGTFEG